MRFNSKYKIFSGAVFFLVLFAVISSNAQAYRPGALPGESSYFNGPSIDLSKVQISDVEGLKAAEKELLAEDSFWQTDWAKKAQEIAKQAANATGFKRAIHSYLQRLAYETAVYVATGDKGQAPMFYTDSIGDFISNEADKVAGYYIESLGSKIGKDFFGNENFSLCRPSVNFKVRVISGLLDDYGPKKPDCTFTEMQENWEEESQKPDFLNNFSSYFGLGGNDITGAFALHTNLSEEMDKKAQEAMLERLQSAFKPVTDAIGGEIKTPGNLVAKLVESNYDKSSAAEEVFTGNAVADYIAVFTDTLIGKLIEKWLKEGLIDNAPDNSYDWERLTSEFADSGSYSGGVGKTKDRYYDLVKPDFIVNEPYEILTELIHCPDPNDAGPTECVLWKDNGDVSSFYQAIIGSGNDGKYYTVGTAMEAGLLHRDGIFGFVGKNMEPKQPDNLNSYSYRNMKILRKYRILPVGWEIAAELINQNMDSRGPKTLGDMVACYDPRDSYAGYSDEWCQGLVDPNWVLRAPANFCKRKGPGPVVSEGSTSGGYQVNRDQDYCADEQTCIKEDENGRCEAYGYCTEDRSTWDMGAEECDPKYNTCTVYAYDEGRDKGKKTAYLANTLESENCDADNAGCRAYCTEYDLAIGNFSCTQSGGQKIYADREISLGSDCGAEDEGCREFIRTASGKGANMIINSSFEQFSGQPDDPAQNEAFAHFSYSGGQAVSAATTDIMHGATAVLMSGPLEEVIAVGPGDGEYQIDSETFVFSLFSKNCSPGDTMSIIVATQNGLNAASTTLNTTPAWSRNSVRITAPQTANSNSITISVDSDSCFIDGLMLERGNSLSSYRDYREGALIYQKLMPAYCQGHEDEEACLGYVRYCSYDELGCEMYTSQDGFTIPAKAAAEDYCPSECDGYDEYLQTETSFDSLQAANIIPAAGKTCNARSAGCDEFTNLDRLGAGAEALEYYSELRHCRKPDGNCREFYTWEGSDQSGYQLKVYSLEASPSGEPQVVDALLDECSKEIYEYPATHPGYDPDCREFYDKNGNISYHLYSLTIECSGDCHPYRRTEKNIIPVDDCQSECQGSCDCAGTPCSAEASEGLTACFWEDGESVFCKNGGAWNYQQQACIYMAIPEQGQKCSASQAGCREYSGQRGSNIRVVFNDDFEALYISDWSGSVSLSSNSLRAGEHSMEVSGTSPASSTLGFSLNKNKSYVLKFLARSNGASEIDTIGIGTSTENGAFVPFSPVPLGLSGEWELYEASLEQLNNENDSFRLSDQTALFIGGDGGFFIDSVRLIEITDRYYLVKSGNDIPDSCYYDVFGGYQGPDYNLGCEAYSDRDKDIHYLRRFSSLCEDSAVGCEIMVDTHNYSEPDPGIWNDASGNGICDAAEPDCVSVPADTYVYAVYDPEKLCSGAQKGCQLLGQQHNYAGQSYFEKYYLANDPDNYDRMLCREEAEGCTSYNGATAFFVDPGDMVCEWRQEQAAETEASRWGWFRKPAKFCDSNNDGSIQDTEFLPCRNNENCPNSQNCVLDERDHDCAVSGTANDFTAFGFGGAVVSQPIRDLNGDFWAGACPVSSGGCGEFIDPVSAYSANLIDNGDFSVNIDSALSAWDGSSQPVMLDSYTLYVLSVEGPNTISITGNTANFLLLNQENFLGTGPVSNLSVSGTSGGRESIVFYTTGLPANNNIEVTVAGTDNNSRVSLSKAIVKYSLDSGINEGDCNGQVDYAQGCVLFNHRAVDSIGENGVVQHEDLLYDADINMSGSNYNKSSSNTNNSNRLIKVLPNRVCSEWLACRTLVKENELDICLDVGLCNSLDENYKCNNFVPVGQDNQLVLSAGSNNVKNKTGYSIMGAGDPFGRDYYPVGAMEQIGNLAQVPNGSFEFYGSNLYPIGWNSRYDPEWGLESAWNKEKFSVIDNPSRAEQEKIRYPIDGESLLRFAPSSVIIESDFIEVEPGASYVLSAYGNTLNFHPGTDFENIFVSVSVLTFDSQGNTTVSSDFGSGFDIASCSVDSQGWISGCPVQFFQGRDWERKSVEFTVGPNTDKIKLSISGAVHFTDSQECNPGVNDGLYYILGAFCPNQGEVTVESPEMCGNYSSATRYIDSETCAGSVYFDNIELRPALRHQDDGIIEQSCRLFPENDSLSCEYFEENGVKKQGWRGYCLENDSYPGSEDNCVLWYPVDRVRGEGIQEGSGYIGYYPLYYCLGGCRADGTGGSCEDDTAPPRSCKDILDINPNAESGLYTIDPDGNAGNDPLDNVYCDMETEGGGWTIINPDGNSGWTAYFTGWNSVSDPPIATPVYPAGSISNTHWHYWLTDDIYMGEPDIEFRVSQDCQGVTYGQGNEASIYNPGSDEQVYEWEDIVGMDAVYRTTGNFYGCNWPNSSPWWYDDETSAYVCTRGNLNDNRQNLPGYCPWLIFLESNGVAPQDYQNLGQCSDSSNWNSAPAIGTDGTHCVAYRNSLPIECSQIAQVVTPSGANKYWSGRVYEGSSYVSLSGAEYNSEYTPFGSLRPLVENYNALTNPYEWDGRPDLEGKQRLFLLDDIEEGYNTVEHQGGFSTYEAVRRIFAESYGIWGWSGGNTCSMSSNNPGAPCSPSADCPEGVCQADYTAQGDPPADFSAINSAWIDSAGNIVFTANDGSYYMYDGAWISGDLYGNDGIWEDEPLAPSSAVNIRAAWMDAANNLTVIDNANYYTFSYSSGTWTSSGSLADEWGDDGVHAPTSYNSIVGAHYNDTTDILTIIQSNDMWFQYDYGAGLWLGRCDQVDSSSWPGSDLECCEDYQATGDADGCSVAENHSLSQFWGTGSAIPASNIINAIWEDGSAASYLTPYTAPPFWLYRYDLGDDGTYASGDGFIPGNQYGVLGYSMDGDICVGGLNDGEDCANQCVNGYCQSGESAYSPLSGLDWGPPGSNGEANNGICQDTGTSSRPTSQPQDYCAIVPRIENIRVNGESGGLVSLDSQTQFAHLTFNTRIDGQQLPLVLIAIDWGDGEETVVSGVQMRDQTNPDNPHSFYHLYSYWDMASNNTAVCINDSCLVQPRIKIKDNWGWCSCTLGNGCAINDCNNTYNWIPFNGSITISK